MEFVKNNWLKLTLAVVALLGGIFVTILLLGGPVKDASLGEFTDGVYNSSLYMLIGEILFFVGIIAYLILSMFDQTKKIAGIVLAVISVLVLILMVLSLTSGIDYMNASREKIQAGFEKATSMPSGVAIPELNGLTKEAFVNSLEVSEYAITTALYTKLLSTLVFAVAPLIFSIKKIFNTEE